MRWFLLMLVAFAAACATPNKTSGFNGGYSETQLSQNSWTVTFQRNGYTSHERATDFALLRSADVALEHGFNYFIIDQKPPGSSYTIVCFKERPENVPALVYDANFVR